MNKQLTKDKCDLALELIKESYAKGEFQYDYEEIHVIDQLINEHFAKGKSCKGCQLKEDFKTLSKVFDCLLEDYHKLKNNPPLKFEELEENMWVWDNKDKEWCKYISYQTFEYLDGYGSEFEENRFYRYEVKE